MRVVFAALGQEQLGISILSAVLRRAGHETALAFNPALFNDRYYFEVPFLGDWLDRTDEVIDDIVSLKPDLVAMSVLTSTYTWCLDVAKAVKARLDVPVIFGGVHPSAVPEVCLENACVDYVCVGEGEQAILDLCDALERGHHPPKTPIPNLVWRDHDRLVHGPAAPFLQDLDSLPFWDKALWENHLRVGDNYLTMTSRGCPYRCTFCFNNFFARLPGKTGGKYVRQRSVDHAMAELVLAKQRYSLRRVELTDDIFTLDKEWIRAFLDRYKREIGVPFQCLVHAKFIDREVAAWLKEAGCEHVQMGVQSMDEAYKKKTLLRVEKDVHLERALEAITAAGLAMKLDHILGFPGESKEAQSLARELYVRFPPKRVNTFWLTYLPGIDLTKTALEQGELTPAQVDRVNRGQSRLFRHGETVKSAADLDFYQRYDLLFRMLPALPRSVAERLRPEHLPAMSPRASNAAGFLFDLANAIARMDGETFQYARHYAVTLARQVAEKAFPDKARPALRVLPPTGTRPRDAGARSAVDARLRKLPLVVA